MTGTMLGVHMSGTEDDPYSTKELLNFLWHAGLSALFALASTMVSFIVSARGTDAYSLHGGKVAHEVMQQSVLFISFSECAVYVSMAFFLLSWGDYLKMNYTGPDICPTSRTEERIDVTKRLRQSSWCSMLGRDYYDTAVAFCANFSSAANQAWQEHDLCYFTREFVQASRSRGIKHELKRDELIQYFGWDDDVTDAVFGKQTGFDVRMKWLSVMEAIGDAYCQRDPALAERQASCASPKTLQERLLCSSAVQAFLQADECTDKQLQDAENCRRVCSWVSESQSPRMPLLAAIKSCLVVGETVLILFVACRAGHLVSMSSSIIRLSVGRYGCLRSLLLQCGILEFTNVVDIEIDEESEESDEEQQLAISPTMTRSS